MVKKQRKVSSDTMIITIAKFGSDPENVTIPTGSTVGDALREAGVTVKKNWELFVDGDDAETKDILENGDILSIVTPKEAGNY